MVQFPSKDSPAMPLLKRKKFEKVAMPRDLRDDEEVFHCVQTNEVFRNYE